MDRQLSLLGCATSICLACGVVVAQAGEFSLSHPYPDDSAKGIWAREFALCAGRAVGISVRVVPDSRFGYPVDLARATAEGLVDISLVPASAFATLWPAVAALGNPGQVLDPKDLVKLSDQSDLIVWMNELARGHSNVLGDRRGSMVLLGIGWEYDALVGKESTLENLRGKKLNLYSEVQRPIAEQLGAESMFVPYGELFPAMQYGVVDAAVVDAEDVLDGVRSGAIRELQGSPDFAPFYYPIVIVMNRSTASVFGEDIPNRVIAECSDVTHKFNESSRERLGTITKEAEQDGVKIVLVTDVDRAKWREAFQSSTKYDGEVESVTEKIRSLLGAGAY